MAEISMHFIANNRESFIQSLLRLSFTHRISPYSSHPENQNGMFVLQGVN